MALTDDDLIVPAVVAGWLIWLAGFATVTYWPTRRPPTRLYHYTSQSVADQATIAHHDDGSVTIRLVPTRRRLQRWLRVKPKVYCFPRPADAYSSTTSL